MNILNTKAQLMAVTVLLAVMSVPALAVKVSVPRGTDVPLIFDKAFSSKTAKVGDRVPMHVSNSVVVNGHTILASGTHVVGVLSSVEKRKRYGVNARMQITLNPIRLSSRNILTLEPKTKGKYAGSRTDQAAYATGGGALLLGPIGLAGGYFVVGKQVNIKVGDKLISEVSRDVTLNL